MKVERMFITFKHQAYKMEVRCIFLPGFPMQEWRTNSTKDIKDDADNAKS